MSRAPRIMEPFVVFHVINRGNDRSTLFRNDLDYIDFIEIAAELKVRYPVKIYHYVLMPNHVHLMMEPLVAGSMSKFMQRLQSAFAIRTHREHGGCGHLWQSRFKSFLIDRDSYFLQCAKYIELNPVRAGLVGRPGDYRWSSHRHYAFGEPSRLIDEDRSFFALGSDLREIRIRYRSFFLEDPGVSHVTDTGDDGQIRSANSSESKRGLDAEQKATHEA